MTTATTIPTKLKKSQVTLSTEVDFTDNAVGTFLMLLVVAGSGIPDTSKTGVQYVANVTSGNTEVTGTGYSRQTLTSVAVAFDGTSTTQVNWNFANVTFAQNASGFSNARYGAIYCTQIGSADASWPVVAILDLGATQSVVSAALVLTCPAAGLIQWT